MDMIFWLTSLKGVLDFRDWEEKNLDNQREKKNTKKKEKKEGKDFSSFVLKISVWLGSAFLLSFNL